jgi:argininosuccinate synthase
MNAGFTGENVRGFTRIFGNQVGIYHRVQQSAHEKD